MLICLIVIDDVAVFMTK